MDEFILLTIMLFMASAAALVATWRYGEVEFFLAEIIAILAVMLFYLRYAV